MDRTHRHRLFVVAGLFALALLLTPSVAALLRPDGVHAAWERARSAGSYRFDGDVVQVTTPSATVGNAGRASREERLHLEGDTSSRARTLEMRLWARDGSAAQDESGVAVRVADGKTSIRQGSRAWKDAGDVTGTVAPQGDFMAYLGAVRDVTAHEPETRAGIAFTRYTFRLDGPAFAAYMRDQTEAALARQGELPPGTRIETPKALAKMAGQGELWVGRDGLPLRQIIDVAFPEQGTETVSARITINFSNFGSPVVSWLGTGLVSRTVSDLLYDPFPLYQMLLWSALAVMLVRFRRSRRLQEALALVVIAALVLGPVLSGHRVNAFLGVQSAKAAEQQQGQQESDMQQTLRRLQAENAFDPHASPMASTIEDGDGSAQLETAASTVDGMAPAVAAAAPAQVASNDGTDTDADGLSDYLEERLGTEPKAKDSDNDGVDDGVEVRGFSFDGKQWYGDPQNVDSNRDTLGDGQEWYTDTNNDGTPDDTDGDKAPDLFDADNDGDGVPDSKDTSPVSHSLMSGGAGAAFSESTPFKLSMQDITPGKPTYVDFQLRPTDDKHLWFAHNVLDWPLDAQAQILDKDDATWADRAAAEGRASEENESNGDLKLVPMLEIRMAGGSNLPNEAELTPYNIAVNELADFPTAGSTGKVAYVPLTMVADDQTGARVAFNGRMLYRPGASWGTADQVRLVWLVQALVDRCKQFTDGLCTEWEQPLNQSQVLQTYYDEWTLTGLSVREDNGVKMATIYENPTAETGGVADSNLNDDTPLWMLAGGLDGSFLVGRDEGGNGRDVTVDEIYARFNRTTNNSIGDTDVRRWGIPDVLTVERHDYEHLDLGVANTISDTNRILDNTFTSSWTSANQIKPLVMFAREERARELGLDSGALGDGYLLWSGSQLAVDFSPANKPRLALDTYTGLKWSSFCADTDAGGSLVGWNTCEQDLYWQELDARHAAGAGEQGDPPEVAAGKAVVMQLFFLAIANGVRSIVESDGNVVSGVYSQKSDTVMENDLRTAGKGGVSGVAGIANLILMATVEQKVGLWKFLGEKLGAIKATGATFSRWLRGTFGQIGARSVIGGVSLALVGAIIATAVILDKYIRSGNQDADLAAKILLKTVVLSIIGYLSVVAPIMDARNAVSALRAVNPGLTKGAAWAKLGSEAGGTSKAAGFIGAAIAVGITWGFFIYSMVSNNVTAFSPEFNRALAETIAATIYIVVLAVLSATLIGLIIVGIVALIDGILTAVCELGVDALRTVPGMDGACFTLGNGAVKVLAKVLYSFDSMIDTDHKTNDVSDLVVTGELDVQRTDPNRGFTPDNPLLVKLPVTTTVVHKDPAPENWIHIVPYLWLFSEGNLRSSTVRYGLAREAQELNAERDQMENEWDNVRRDHGWAFGQTEAPGSQSMYRGQDNTTLGPLSIALPPGLNQTADFYLNQGYAFPAYECWGIPNPPFFVPPIIPVCYPRTIDGTSSSYINALKFDILPNTVGEFMTLADAGNGDFRLGWDARFPALQDADGDGLRAGASGGLDANDAKWDGDDDGLSDKFEAERRAEGVGFSAGTWDTDLDTLTDAQELQFGSDPNRPDTDRDGLADNLEVWHQRYSFVDTNSDKIPDTLRPTNTWEGGWDVTVAGVNKPGGGTESVTVRVSSDPTEADSDGDGVLDSAEKALAESTTATERVDRNGVPFHPHVANVNPLELSLATNDRDGIVRLGQTVVYSATVDSGGVQMAPGVVEVNAPSQLGGGATRSVIDLSTNTQQTLSSSLTVGTGASSGPATLSGLARMRMPGSGTTGFAWETPQEETPIGDGMTTAGRSVDATASRTDRQDSFLLSTLTSSSEYQDGTGDIRLDNPLDTAFAAIENDNENTSFLRGATAPSIATANNGNSMAVWDHKDNCNTLTISSITVTDADPDPNGGIEPNVWLNDQLIWITEPFDHGEAEKRDINRSYNFCGPAKLQVYESDGSYKAQFIGEMTIKPERLLDGNYAFTGSDYQVYLTMSTPAKHNWDIAGAIVGSDTGVHKSRYSLTSTATGNIERDFHPVVASDGANFLVAWERITTESIFLGSTGQREEVATTRVMARRFDSAGNPLGAEVEVDTETLTFASPAYRSYRDLDLAWISDHWRVAWKTERSSTIKTRNVLADGTVSPTPAETATTEAATTSAGAPHMAYNPDNGRTLLVFCASDGTSGAAVRGVLYNQPTDHASASFAIADFPQVVYPQVAYHPTTRGWLVSWMGADPQELRYLALNGDGTPLLPGENPRALLWPRQATSTDTALACPTTTSTPALELRFEELPGAAAFADSSGNNRNVTIGTTSPSAGAIAAGAGAAPFSDYAAAFDGADDVASVAYAPTGDFTISFWFKSNQTSQGTIVASDGFAVTLDGGKLLFSAGGATAASSATAVADGNWHFVTVTRRAATGEIKLYLDDGDTPADTETHSNGSLAGTTLSIGRAAGGGSFYQGLVDQITIYPSVLGDDSVDEIRDRQSPSFCLAAVPAANGIPWVRLRLTERDGRGDGPFTDDASLTLLVDGDKPTATVSSFDDGAYIQGGSNARTIIIGGTAGDQTSDVDKVEVSVNNGAWQQAEGAATWSYALPASEGVYSVKARATDVAGNAGDAGAARTLIVDATAPQLAVAGLSAAPLVPQRTTTGQWSVSLSGTATDSAIDGEPGSGVEAQSVEVLLRGTAGSPEGNGWQQAALNGGSWTVDYVFPAGLPDPTGGYTVLLRAADNAGNLAETEASTTLNLDAAGPVAVLDPASATRTHISAADGLNITGRITETGTLAGLKTLEASFVPVEQVLALSNTVLLLPFDEPAGAVYHADSSTSFNHAACATAPNCPTVGVQGRVDGALRFAGNARLSVADAASIDFDTSKSFSVQAWVKPSAGTGIVLAKSDGTGGQYVLRLENGLPVLTVQAEGSSSPAQVAGEASVVDDAWHHLVGVVDRVAGSAGLYVDGVLAGSTAFTGSTASDGNLQIGGSSVFANQDFSGLVDQVAIFDRALVPAHVAALYRAAGRTWYPVTLAQSGAGTSATTWSFDVPAGLEGQYQLDLRGSDTLGNRRVTANAWRGIVDATTPRVTLTATATGVDYFDTTTNQRMYEIAYTCVARDRYIDDTALVCPNAPDTLPTRDFADTSGTEELFPDMTVRDQLSLSYTTWETSTQPTTTATSCDTYGNCGSAAAQTVAGAAAPMAAMTAEVVTAAASLPRAVIVNPLSGSYATSSQPLNVTVAAESAQALQQVTLSLDGTVVDTTTWRQQANVTNAQYAVAVTVAGEGPHTLVAQATDWAGTVQTTLYPVEITVDDTAPELTLATTVLDENSTMEEGSGVMRFNGTASDGLGLAAVQVSLGGATFADATFDGTTWSTALWLGEGAAGQEFVVTVRAIDVAGLITTVTRTLTADVDAPPIENPSAPPETTITAGPAALVYSHRSTFSFAGTDDVTAAAGLRFVCRVDGGSYVPCTSPHEVSGLEAGAHVFEVRAIDGQGQADATPAAHTWTSAVYPFTGFVEPVKNAPALNVVQAGQTVSVKFSLGGNRGMAIFDQGSPSWQLINCVTKAPIDKQETVADGSLQYDAKLKQYNYTWRTDKTWLASCRQLVIRLADGTTQPANFQITR